MERLCVSDGIGARHDGMLHYHKGAVDEAAGIAFVVLARNFCCADCNLFPGSFRRKSIRRGCVAEAERLWQAVSGASGGFVYLVNDLNDRRERVSLFFVLKGKWRQYDLSGTV